MRQKYIFIHATPLAHYRAQAFIVRCFDDRFRAVFEKFLKARKIARADLESVAGGAKVFSSPEKAGDRDFMLRELEKSIRLHHTKKAMLFTHYDCGAYGGRARFQGNEREQIAFHRDELANAKMHVLKTFPNLAVETYFIDAKGVITVS